jgi:peptidoglycan/xylan/chitin deacetylase (PgdA/CDA1 family)
MTPHARTGSDGRLSLGPAWVQAAKPLLVSARTTRWRACGARRHEGLRILFYHRISDDRDLLAVTPKRFRAQMALLADAGCRVVDVADAWAMLARGESPPGVVGLSFDDGYRDIAEHALPVLEQHGFRASVFVATSVVDGSASFSWYASQPAVLSWSDIVALDRDSPFRFEAHTLTHPDLRALRTSAVEREIAGSKDALEEHLGRRVDVFCYPAGLFGRRERAIVARAGFRAATSCEPGANSPRTDPFALRRVAVHPRDRLSDFAAKLAGAHDRPSSLRGAYRRLRFGAAASVER